MFKRILSLTIFLGLISLHMAHASVSLQLDPPGGDLSGASGASVGWGFSLSNTENYLVVTSASFEPATPLGTFTDYISAPENFFVVGPGLGASKTWTQSFDASEHTGIGSFVISASATPSTSASGEIVISYDLFSRSPLNPNFNPDTDTLSNGNVLTANASVSTIVPLPTAAWLFGSAMIGGFGISKRSRWA